MLCPCAPSRSKLAITLSAVAALLLAGCATHQAAYVEVPRTGV